MDTAAVIRYCGISLTGISLLMLVSAGVAFHEKSEAAMVPLLYAGTVGNLPVFPYLRALRPLTR